MVNLQSGVQQPVGEVFEGDNSAHFAKEASEDIHLDKQLGVSFGLYKAAITQRIMYLESKMNLYNYKADGRSKKLS